MRETIGASVRMARANKRMSQIEVAQAAGVSTARVSELERGSSDPRLSTVVRVAHALGLTITVSRAA